MNSINQDTVITWLAHGFTAASWWQVGLYALVTTHITIAAVTIFLHRAQAHRALTLHPAVFHFFRLWLWLGTGMLTREWVAIHRKHHAKCETPDDPHSPQTRGIRTVLWTGTELYRSEAKNKETIRRYGHGTPDDWIERNLYSRFTWQGVGLMLIFDLFLFGALGVTVWAVQMAWIPVTAAGIINGLGHYWGYRRFDSPDAATNLSPWGIIIGGEELHNNHHAYPTSAKFSVQSWEFDIGWTYIRCLELFHLAKAKRAHFPPEVFSDPRREVPDGETLAVVQRLRFRFLRELRRLRERQPQAVADWSGALQSFQSLWTDPLTKAELIVRLQHWHAQAMMSGSAALEKFARELVKLRLKPA